LAGIPAVAPKPSFLMGMTSIVDDPSPAQAELVANTYTKFSALF
jgi:hypothetical protein